MKDTFEKHASPQAIEAALQAAERKAAYWREEVRRLKRLRSERRRQIRRGEWPPVQP